MTVFFEYYETNKDRLHLVILSANMHEKRVAIHPFIDSNGRTARLVMNLILLKLGYPITIISSENKAREQYYRTLETAQISENRDNSEFVKLVANYVKRWLFVYLETLSESIGDESKNKGVIAYSQRIKYQL